LGRRFGVRRDQKEETAYSTKGVRTIKKRQGPAGKDSLSTALSHRGESRFGRGEGVGSVEY